jgi:hypothetical protein
VNTLQNKLDELQRAYRKIEDTTVAIKAKEIETVHAVREHFEEIMAAVLRRKQTLITQAKLMSAQKIRQLSQQKAAMSHIMARCQSVIQNCQSALECHDCTMFETWANLNDKVKAVVDLSCHIEPVTSCDLVCHLPRDVVCLLKQHGFIRPRPGCVDSSQQPPVETVGSTNDSPSLNIPENSAEAADEAEVEAIVTTGESAEEQSHAWESAVTATAIQESLFPVAEDGTDLLATLEQSQEADDQSVEDSDQGTVEATSMSLSQGDSDMSEQGSITPDTEQATFNVNDHLLNMSTGEVWSLCPPMLNFNMENERRSRHSVEDWTRDVVEAQDNNEVSENAELEEEEEEEEEEDQTYLTPSGRRLVEEQLSRLLEHAALRNDRELPDVVARSREQALVQLSTDDMEEDNGHSLIDLHELEHPVWTSRNSFSLLSGPFSLLFGDSQNEDEDEEGLREEDSDTIENREEYDDEDEDTQRNRQLDLIDFEQEPVGLEPTSRHDHQLSRLNHQQDDMPATYREHLPQLISSPVVVSRCQLSNSSSNSRHRHGGATSSSDHDEADLVEHQVNRFLGLSLSASAGATSSSDFELAPESSGSDSDTHGVAQCSMAALTAAANVADRHRRIPRAQGRGKGMPRPWSSRRGVPFSHYFMPDRSTVSHSSRSAAAAAAVALATASQEPRSLPIPANSVCGHCPRPAKARCCSCSRLFCDNCKRYNGIPCANGSVEHSFTAFRRVKSKSRRPTRHAPFCNAAVELPVHEDDEGIDSPFPVTGTASSPRRQIHNRLVRLVRRDIQGRLPSYSVCHSGSPVQSPPRPRLWRCDHCTYFNDPHLSSCEACGQLRIRIQGEGITCSHCTLLNPAGSQWCEACDTQLEDEEKEVSAAIGENEDCALACAL